MMEQNKYSNNFLHDLATSLENAPEIFVDTVCRGIRWSNATFKQRRGTEINRGIDIYDYISKQKICFVLNVYDDVIGMQQLSNRSMEWKARLTSFNKPLIAEYIPPIRYSSNILNDLYLSLENAAFLFRDLVCLELSWTPKDFEAKRIVPIAQSFETFESFTKRQIGIIIKVYHELIINIQVHTRALNWKVRISNS